MKLLNEIVILTFILTCELWQASSSARNPVSTQPVDASAQMQTQIQGLLDRAKNLTDEKKYAEALLAIKALSAFKLSSVQQARTDDIKSRIQKAVAAQLAPNGLKFSGGLIPGK